MVVNSQDGKLCPIPPDVEVPKQTLHSDKVLTTMTFTGVHFYTEPLSNCLQMVHICSGVNPHTLSDSRLKLL